MIKPLLKFIPAKWKVREEVKAKGEGQLALGENSLLFWEERLGWSPEAARYLATAFAFGVRENIAAVLERAQQLSESPNFEKRFVNRSYEDSSVSGAVLEASKFISSKELRDLLGRILASDVSKPGSVSRRAVSLAQDLTPNDLREFLKLRAVFWHDPTSAASGHLLVLGKRLGLYAGEFLSFGSDEIGVNYYTFGEFQPLGLIQERSYGMGLSITDQVDGIYLTNCKRTISLRPTGEQRTLQAGMYAVTNAGGEILSLFIDAEFPALEGYFEEVCAYWRGQGLEVQEVDGHP